MSFSISQFLLCFIAPGFAAFFMAAVTAIAFNGGRAFVRRRTPKESAHSEFFQENKFAPTFYVLKPADWTRAVILGLGTGALNYFSMLFVPAAPWLFAVTVAMLIYTMVWWQDNCSSAGQLVPFALMAVPMFFALNNSAEQSVSNTWINGFFASVFRCSFWIVLTIVVSFYIVSLLYRYCHYYYEGYKHARYLGNGKRADREYQGYKMCRTWAWAIKIIALLIVTLIVIFGFNWKALDNGTNPNPNPDPDPNPSTSSTSTSTWYRFYNDDLQVNISVKDDYNFGKSAVKKNRSAKDYDRIFRTRVQNDPALAAAVIAYKDAIVKTETYVVEGKKGMQKINAAKKAFMNDQQYFYETIGIFFDDLDRATVKVKKAKGLTDQMYMNPREGYSPQVVVCKTNNHTGYMLVYTFRIKGQKFEVKYRINCGFQPTNCAKVLKVKPKPVPTPKSSPSNPTNPKDNPTNPSPTPTNPTPTTPKYNKDPSKAPKINTEKNDDLGPGKDTNNGKGAQKSKDDSQYNYGNSPSSKKVQEDQKARNNNPSNTPSTKGGGAAVDNPGANDNLYTPTQGSAKTGGHSVTDDKDGGDWGSPPD